MLVNASSCLQHDVSLGQRNKLCTGITNWTTTNKINKNAITFTAFLFNPMETRTTTQWASSLSQAVIFHANKYGTEVVQCTISYYDENRHIHLNGYACPQFFKKAEQHGSFLFCLIFRICISNLRLDFLCTCIGIGT